MALQMMLPGFTQAPGLSLAAPSTDLAAYPDVDPDILQRRAKEIGRAGELLVQSLLTRTGGTLLSGCRGGSLRSPADAS